MKFLILIPVAVVALAVHELGHVAAWRMFGIHVRRIGWPSRATGFGIGIEYAVDRQDLSAAQQLAGAAGGPVASALLAVALWKVSPLFALSSLELGMFNLLPVKGADGRNMLRAARALAQSRTRLHPGSRRA